MVSAMFGSCETMARPFSAAERIAFLFQARKCPLLMVAMPRAAVAMIYHSAMCKRHEQSGKFPDTVQVRDGGMLLCLVLQHKATGQAATCITNL